MTDTTISPNSGAARFTGIGVRMGTLYISEYRAAVAYPFATGAVILNEPPEAVQSVAIGGASAPSAAFGPTTRMIRVQADINCSIMVSPSPGATPVADTTQHRLAAGQTEVLAVKPGDLIAVISNA